MGMKVRMNIANAEVVRIWSLPFNPTIDLDFQKMKIGAKPLRQLIIETNYVIMFRIGEPF